MKQLQAAVGKLAELEDKFVRDVNVAKGNRQRCVKLFDLCKRDEATKEEKWELHNLITGTR